MYAVPPHTTWCDLKIPIFCRHHHRGPIRIVPDAALGLHCMQHDISIKPHFLCVSCRHHHRGPIMIVTEAAGGLQRMQHDVPTLANFPCCEVPSRLADSKYPPLQWQQRAAKVAVHRIAAAGFWLQVLLNAASSGSIRAAFAATPNTIRTCTTQVATETVIKHST